MADAPAATLSENGLAPTVNEEDAPGFKVFAGNLAYSVKDETLREFFAPVQSDILSAQVILRGTRSAGYGFVALASAEAARKAVDLLNKAELDGRSVVVEVAKPADQKDRDRSERRANRKPGGRRGTKAVPGEVTEAEANGEVPKPETEPVAQGEEKPKKKKKISRKKRSPAKQGEASAAASGEDVAGGSPDENKGETFAPEAPPRKRTPKPRRPPHPPRPAGEDPVGEPSKSTIFVANLSFSTDDEKLAAIFTDAGINVVSARVVRRRWGHPRKSKGYGFVDVGTEEEQRKAIDALQGKEIEGGRQIAVKIAVDPPKREESNEVQPYRETPLEAAVVA